MLYKGNKIFTVGQYPAILMPEHHRAVKCGCVYIHVLEAEEKLGRPLRDGECVHHVDENKENFNQSNLWIFKSNSAHVTFHQALRNHNDFVLVNVDGVFDCYVSTAGVKTNILVSGKGVSIDGANRLICPVCGRSKSKTSAVCRSCAKVTYARETKRPEKEVLIDLLKTGNQSSIGRLYGVSGNTVKKWMKFYGLYEKKSSFLPDKDSLETLLKKNSRNAVAEMFGVTSAIVCTWEKNLGISVLPLTSVLCVETNEIFDTKIKAAELKYPELTKHSGANCIAAACKSGNAYRGYHWKYCKDLE